MAEQHNVLLGQSSQHIAGLGSFEDHDSGFQVFQGFGAVVQNLPAAGYITGIDAEKALIVISDHPGLALACYSSPVESDEFIYNPEAQLFG